MGVTNGAETTYPSVAPEFPPFLWIQVVKSLVFYVVICRSLFALFSHCFLSLFFFCPSVTSVYVYVWFERTAYIYNIYHTDMLSFQIRHKHWYIYNCIYNITAMGILFTYVAFKIWTFNNVFCQFITTCNNMRYITATCTLHKRCVHINHVSITYSILLYKIYV